jgi:membrane protein DedA with SNARE-associated domain
LIQQFLDWLSSIGISGLYLAMFLEGSSLPFPGVAIVFSYGYLLAPGYVNTAFIAVGMSTFYTLASFFPYFLGLKLEKKLPQRLQKKLEKGTVFFNRYGIWSIGFSRPFGIGNYISYVAGVSKVHIIKYFTLTFLGIYPWSYIMILLGEYFNGNYEAIKDYFSSYSIYGYGIAIVVIMIVGFTFYKKIRKKED